MAAIRFRICNDFVFKIGMKTTRRVERMYHSQSLVKIRAVSTTIKAGDKDKTSHFIVITKTKFSPHWVILIYGFFCAAKELSKETFHWFMQGRVFSDKINLGSFLSNHWVMDVINLQMCCVREQTLAATQTHGKRQCLCLLLRCLFHNSVLY